MDKNRTIVVDYSWVYPSVVFESKHTTPIALLNFSQAHKPLSVVQMEHKLRDEYNIDVFDNDNNETIMIFPSEEDLTKFLLQWG